MGRKGSEDSQSKTEQSMPSTSNLSSEEGETTSQFHVLAVDDSIIDLKVIEKLLQNSCYKRYYCIRTGIDHCYFEDFI